MADFYGIEITSPSEALGCADWLRNAQQQVFTFLRPKPSHVPLIKIGGDRDGAYLIPDDLEGASRFGISSHMCDFTSNRLHATWETFHKKCHSGKPDAAGGVGEGHRANGLLLLE